MSFMLKGSDEVQLCPDPDHKIEIWWESQNSETRGLINFFIAVFAVSFVSFSVLEIVSKREHYRSVACKNACTGTRLMSQRVRGQQASREYVRQYVSRCSMYDRTYIGGPSAHSKARFF